MTANTRCFAPVGVPAPAFCMHLNTSGTRRTFSELYANHGAFFKFYARQEELFSQANLIWHLKSYRSSDALKRFEFPLWHDRNSFRHSQLKWLFVHQFPTWCILYLAPGDFGTTSLELEIEKTAPEQRPPAGRREVQERRNPFVQQLQPQSNDVGFYHLTREDRPDDYYTVQRGTASKSGSNWERWLRLLSCGLSFHKMICLCRCWSLWMAQNTVREDKYTLKTLIRTGRKSPSKANARQGRCHAKFHCRNGMNK